jgi:ATP phosphoribosyltransferase
VTHQAGPSQLRASPSDRDHHASVDDPGIARVWFLRPQEIPSYIEQGLFDSGITGRDWIAETGADVTSLGELQYSKATSDPVRVALAVPASSPWQSAPSSRACHLVSFVLWRGSPARPGSTPSTRAESPASRMS